MKTETNNKTNKKATRKRRRRILRKIFIYTLLCWLVFFTIAGNFVFGFAIEKESFMTRLSKKGENTAVYSGVQTEEKSNWLTKNSRDMFIYSFDDLKLHALFAENKAGNHRYAIVCHGYTSRASHMSGFAGRFYNMGYSVLVPDARAHGESEGNIRGMGYLERKDILLWINEILKMDSQAQIVLYGVSMGAATVMFTAGEKALPKNVVCVIEDCAFTSVLDEISTQITKYTKLPYSLIAESASVVCRLRGGYSFRQASCIKAVERCKVPMLFIHGSKDTFVPFAMLDKLYDAAECKKEKLVIDGAGHAGSSSTDPELYWRAIETFIKVCA